MLTQATIENMRAMHLRGMAQAYQQQCQNPEADELSFDERLAMLIDHEATHRQNRRQERLLREAKLRLPASPEDIDYTRPRGLDRPMMRSLVSGEWIAGHRNVLITGPTGVGKTYVACALAQAACRRGFTTRYFRVPRLLSELALAKADGSYPRFLARLASVRLLVLDDWALAPLGAGDARDVLEIIDDRCDSRSTLVASQIPIEDWHATIQDPSVADAILDRLVHSAHKIALKGESMRKISNDADQ